MNDPGRQTGEAATDAGCAVMIVVDAVPAGAVAAACTAAARPADLFDRAEDTEPPKATRPPTAAGLAPPPIAEPAAVGACETPTRSAAAESPV